jgi:type IV secretion system protein VirD4
MIETVLSLAAIIFIIWLIGTIIAGSHKDLVMPNDEAGSAKYGLNVEQKSLRPSILIGYNALYSRDHNGENVPFDKERILPDEIFTYTGEGHLLTVGPTRSGKGVGAIIPNLLKYEGSVLVVDPKGENVAKTARARQAAGNKIVVIDPWKITNWPSASYNPLLVNAGTENTAIEDARLIADSLVVTSRDVSQLFFEEEARSVISTLIAHLITSASEPKSLSSLRKIIGYPDKNVKTYMIDLVNNQKLDGFIARGASRFIDKTPNEYSGVLSTIRQHTEFLDSPAIIEAISTSDLRLYSMRERLITIYLVIPVWRIPTYNRWLRLMLTMALTELAQSSANKKVPVLMIVDEFASLGLLPSFDTAFALMAGLGVQLWPIIQDFTQLKKMYGDGWETFVANAEVLQCFGTRDLLTASYISSRMGLATVPMHELSESSQAKTRHGRLVQRALLYPDEVIKLDSDCGIAFIDNSQPLLFHKFKYFQDKIFLDMKITTKS